MVRNIHQLTIRLNDKTYDALKALSNKRGESMAAVARRILATNLDIEIALDASDALSGIVRKVVANELRKTENRLASICTKTAISSATTENLTTYIINQMNVPNLSIVRDAARKRGVAYIREPLDQIMQAYSDEEKGGI